MEQHFYFSQNDTLIKNNYFIIDNKHNDKFHIAIYYLFNNKCKIIVRRLDSNEWGQDLKIQIMDIYNNGFEKFSLGSCEHNMKVIEIYTNITLYKTDYEENIFIPKNIIQIYNIDYYLDKKSDIYDNNAKLSLIELNPEYEYKLYNDTECRLFIKNNYDDINILIAFDMIVDYNLKSELFKYCYLYICGGCYFDNNIILLKPLKMIINKDDKIGLCSSQDNIINSSFILIEKGNEDIYKMLEHIVENIKCKNNQIILNQIQLFHNLFNKYSVNIKVYKNNNNIVYDNNNAIIQYYKNNIYTELLFFEESIIINNYNIFIYPYKENDKFEIKHLKYNIFIVSRVDKNSGWGLFLKIKAIDLKNDHVYHINIGNSDDNEKPFIIE
jgi:hypothetical protein